MYFDEIKAAAIRQAGEMEAQYNAQMAAVYERALEDAAVNLTSKGVPAPHLFAVAAQQFVVDPETLVFTIINTDKPVSTKKLSDYMPAISGSSPGYPVGPPNSFGGFAMLDADHALGEVVVVNGRRFQVASINNSPFSRQYLAV